MAAYTGKTERLVDDVIDATTPTTINSDGTFNRTALILDREKGRSVDLVDTNGTYLGRLNLFDFGNGYVTVDVIDETKSMLVIAMSEGRDRIRAKVPGSVATITINGPQK